MPMSAPAAPSATKDHHRPAGQHGAGETGQEESAQAGARAHPARHLVLRQQHRQQAGQQHAGEDLGQDGEQQAEVVAEHGEEDLGPLQDIAERPGAEGDQGDDQQSDVAPLAATSCARMIRHACGPGGFQGRGNGGI